MNRDKEWIRKVNARYLKGNAWVMAFDLNKEIFEFYPTLSDGVEAYHKKGLTGVSDVMFIPRRPKFRTTYWVELHLPQLSLEPGYNIQSLNTAKECIFLTEDEPVIFWFSTREISQVEYVMLKCKIKLVGDKLMWEGKVVRKNGK